MRDRRSGAAGSGPCPAQAVRSRQAAAASRRRVDSRHRHARPPVRTSLAALAGSVGPSPYAGQQARHRAGTARRVAGVAHATAVPDQVVAQQRPVLLREQRADLVLDLHRVGLRGQAEPARQPAEVGVHGDARHPERVPEDHVRRLAPDAGERDQVHQPAGHLTVVPLDQRLGELEERVGLGAEEARRLDDLLDLLALGGGERGRVRVRREQGRGHRVDPPVRRLRAQHGRDEELEGVLEVELAPRVGVGLGEHPVDLPGAPDEAGSGPVPGRGRAPGQGTAVQ